MIYRRLNSPGDPPVTVALMFGEEFVEHVRKGKPAIIQVGDTTPLLVQEVICDSCNNEVGLADPCLVMPGWLFCWECAAKMRRHLEVSP